MTCNGCVAKVKSELLKLGDIESANVQLSAPQATITMQKHVPLHTLQNAVSEAGNFTILPDENHSHHSGETAETKSWLQIYKPLLLIFTYIAGIATLASLNNQSINLQQWMNHFMAGFFISFSFLQHNLNNTNTAESHHKYCNYIAVKRLPVY